jgi:transcriptional regulator with XRE-family HTH domain
MGNQSNFMAAKATPFLDAGQYLKRVRKALGLSQIELAETMAQLINRELPGEEFSQSTVSQLERGYIRLNKVKIRLLFQVLGLSPEEKSQLSRLYHYESSPQRNTVSFHQQTYLQELGEQAQEQPSDFFIRANQISCYMQLGETQMAIMHIQDALEKVRQPGAQEIIVQILNSKLLSAQYALETSRSRQLDLLQRAIEEADRAQALWQAQNNKLKNRLSSERYQQIYLHLLLARFTPLFQLFNHQYGRHYSGQEKTGATPLFQMFYHQYSRAPLSSTMEEIQLDFENLSEALSAFKKALSNMPPSQWFIDLKFLEREEIRLKYLYQEVWQARYLFRYFRTARLAASAKRIREVPQALLKNRQKIKVLNTLRNLFGVTAQGQLTLMGSDSELQKEAEALQKYTEELAIYTRAHFQSYQQQTQNMGLYSADTLFSSSFTSTLFLSPLMLARLGHYSDLNLETLYFLSHSNNQAEYQFLCAQYFALRYIFLCLQGNSEQRLDCLEKSAQHFLLTGLPFERIFAEPQLWLAYLLAIYREDEPPIKGGAFIKIREMVSSLGDKTP